MGVFVCHCGINIAGTVDVEAVREYASTLPYVVYTGRNLFTCSRDTQEAMKDIIREHHSTAWWWPLARRARTSRSSRRRSTRWG